MADSSKTEQPTLRRLLKAQTEGQFVASRELVAAGQFLVFIAILGYWFPGWFSGMKKMMRDSLPAAFHETVSVNSLPGIASAMLRQAFLPFAVVGGLTGLTTLAVHLTITKFGFSPQKLSPDFTRFNPVSKVQNLIRQGPSAVAQAVVMLLLFGATIYMIAKQNAEAFLSLPFASLDIGIQKVAVSLKELLWKAAGVFLIFGLFDLFRQRKRFVKDLKMTKHEVKQEFKENEVSPQIKGKIRRLQRDFARRRMMHEVATATAVIVNPTHYAIALRYSHESMATPLVVAKGKNYLALRIRQRALDHGVPLVENPPLAQALYKSVDVGREIPPHLYRAVAEVLAYIYGLTKRRK